MKTLSQRRDRFFKHPVRRRVRDHDGRQVVLVFFRLRPKIFQIDVAVVVGLDLCVVDGESRRGPNSLEITRKTAHDLV